MYSFALRHGLINGFGQRWIAEKVTVFNGFSNASEVLIHHTTSTKVHMANFRVAHLSIWQANIHAAARNKAVWVLFAQLVIDRRIGTVNGVVVRAVAMTKTVENH